MTSAEVAASASKKRGRVVTKVHPGLIEATSDVPDDDFLLDRVSTPHKPLPGHIVFFETQGGAARETLAWAAGQGVGYRDEFLSGGTDTGAYVCHLTIADPALTLDLILTSATPAQVPPRPGYSVPAGRRFSAPAPTRVHRSPEPLR